MKRPNNDEITKIFDWLYIGGERNIRKTLPHITVWYDFRHDKSNPKNLSIPENIIVNNRPFDDGDLMVARKVWESCFHEIQQHRENGDVIFVSCTEGMSRSAVLCLWLAAETFQSYDKALTYIKTCRNIYPDRQFSPFLKELKTKYS